LLAGVTQEGEDRRQHQNRFQAFAQQNQQAGDVAQRPAQAIAAEQLGGLELALGRVQALLGLRDRQAVLQRLTVGHQRFFGVLAHVGVDVVQRAFDQLETFQIRRHRQVIGLIVVTGAVGRQALVQRAAV
jgi:hypothetical protein